MYDYVASSRRFRGATNGRIFGLVNFTRPGRAFALYCPATVSRDDVYFLVAGWSLNHLGILLPGIYSYRLHRHHTQRTVALSLKAAVTNLPALWGRWAPESARYGGRQSSSCCTSSAAG